MPVDVSDNFGLSSSPAGIARLPDGLLWLRWIDSRHFDISMNDFLNT